MLGAELLEILLEEGTHGDDAVGHVLDLAQPLLVQLGVAEDLGGNAGAVDGRVGVQRADEDLQLGVDTLLLLSVGGGDGEGTDTLSVETLFLAEVVSRGFTHHPELDHYDIRMYTSRNMLTMFLANDWQRATSWPCSTK